MAGPGSASTRGSVLLTSVWSCSPRRERLLEVVPRRPHRGFQRTPHGEGLGALCMKLERCRPTPTHFRAQRTHFTEAAHAHVGWCLPQTDLRQSVWGLKGPFLFSLEARPRDWSVCRGVRPVAGVPEPPIQER